MGLRERKKQRMYESVSETAIRLFLERGFDAVSVAEVAAAAEISKPTLFRYFPAKEDLVLHRIVDHEREAARVVEAAPDVPPLHALRRHFLERLAAGDPITGLNDHPQVVAFHSLVYGTPSLVARMYRHLERSEAALAEALGGDLESRLAAGQVVAAQRILAEENFRRVAAGEPVDAVRPDAVAAAERAFGLLEEGLRRFATA
ncbi:TetR/AcrR family transcriptional regulator [Streptomyces longwoodensis]|uniref:TetR family transcriptional regulator n=1 Tax=Streptomyces longwoodensis TaxID=68231 RepID=UPI002ED2E9D4|nr:TetR/AcrR family transcriptional regulator [Streptomyces longwoodensis]